MTRWEDRVYVTGVSFEDDGGVCVDGIVRGRGTS